MPSFTRSEQAILRAAADILLRDDATHTQLAAAATLLLASPNIISEDRELQEVRDLLTECSEPADCQRAIHAFDCARFLARPSAARGIWGEPRPQVNLDTIPVREYTSNGPCA